VNRTLNVITPSTVDVLRREEVLEHLRASDDEWNLITRLIDSARSAVELHVGRALLPQTLELRLDEWEDEIILPRPPLRSVTAVKYVNDAGTVTTVSPSVYRVLVPSGPTAGFGRIVLAYGQSWPTLRSEREAVRVEYVAGYLDADSVPSQLKSAMLLLLGDFYEHREAQVQGPQVALVENRQVEWLLKQFHVAWP